MPEQTDQERLHQIIADTIARRESGEQVSDDDVLRSNPELADQLRPKLKQLALLADARVLADRQSIEETVSVQVGGILKVRSGELNDSMNPGDQLRHYVLQEQIGTGGFGSVWRAKDLKLECEVAVKVPRRELSSDDTEQFIHEARTAAQLRKHPNIVSVHEADWDDGKAFIVSDYVDGFSLDARLDHSRVSVNESVQLMVTICAALQHAHEQGIIHRDLKPENILLDQDGVPHITDFGLALRASQLSAVVPGRITGTAAYMSPEQARGESDRANRQSDIFSLGIVFFELLTGEKPYRGSVPHVLQQIISADPPRPRSLDSQIPVDLETICLKCLEKEPVRRYGTVGELSDDLTRFMRHEPIEARPISSAGRLLRWSRRNPSIPLLSLSLLIVIMVSTWTAFRFLDVEVGKMQQELTARADKSLALLAHHTAREAELELAARYYQVARMTDDLGSEAIEKLRAWNGLDPAERTKTLELLREVGSDKNADFPIPLQPIQSAVETLENRTADRNLLERTYSFFVCDQQGYQIARLSRERSLGQNFAHRSYFSGRTEDGTSDDVSDYVWHPKTNPRISCCFMAVSLKNNGMETPVISVSAPIWEGDEFQGVAGVFIELGELVGAPQGTEGSGQLLMFDVRPGIDQARLIHNRGQEIKEIKVIDMSPIIGSLPTGEQNVVGIVEAPVLGEGFWRAARRPFKTGVFKQSINSGKESFVVMTVEPAKTIQSPGRRLRANLVAIGSLVIVFALAILAIVWFIILRRVVKT